MARKKKDWTPKQGKWTKTSMEEALHAVRAGKISRLKASKIYDVPRTTLLRRLTNMDPTSPPTRPPVLNAKEEEALVSHILQMEERGFGLSIRDVCCLAFSIVHQAGREHPFNKEKRSAGYDWWQGFRDRHPGLAVRKPEGLSAARSAMLNPNVITTYFNTLSTLMDKLELKGKPQQIFNADESGFSTVHQPARVVGKRGKKAVHAKTSGERGENITVLCCVNAEAKVLPPMVIFKGERVSQALMGNAPPNTLFACSKSSFIDTELFNMWFEKIFLANLPPQRPVLLVLDGHSSHISINLLEKAKSNSVEIFCLPPHTTHWTQPLDRSVFGPLKKTYYKNCETFMKKNPGNQITRYHFCGLFGAAFKEKLNMVNVSSGFKSTGIYPFNPLALPSEAYGPSKTSTLPADHQPKEVIAETEETSESSPKPVPPTSGDSVLQDLLKLPEVIKETSTLKKTKKTTKARCLTEVEFMAELKQKEETKRQTQCEKELRKKERDDKRKLKEREKLQKEMKKTLKGKKSRSKKAKTITEDKENESENDLYCQHCHGYYYDEDSDDEDWWKCSKCEDWYHESCTGAFGSALHQFTCKKHK